MELEVINNYYHFNLTTGSYVVGLKEERKHLGVGGSLNGRSPATTPPQSPSSIGGNTLGHMYSMFKTSALPQALEYLCFYRPSGQLCADDGPRVQSNQ